MGLAEGGQAHSFQLEQSWHLQGISTQYIGTTCNSHSLFPRNPWEVQEGLAERSALSTKPGLPGFFGGSQDSPPGTKLI